jgi:phospholipase C
VIWIWFENRSFGNIVGRPGSAAYANSPYLNSKLVRGCGVATNYHVISHPSLPNYIAATAGTTGGLTRDCDPVSCAQRRPSLFSQLAGHGMTWRSYVESMPANCDRVDSDVYGVRHNPAVFYPLIRRRCRRWDVPLGRPQRGPFVHALRANRLPSFAFITPNLCHDTHDCPVRVGDRWLARWIPIIAASAPYREGNVVLFVTWDEGSDGEQGTICALDLGDPSCHVPLLVVSPYTPRATRSPELFNHYSLLKTAEQMLGFSTFVGHAGDSTTQSMRSAFHL